MSIQRVQKLINDQERDALVKWIFDNKDTEMFRKAEHPGTVRVTTRYVTNDVEYPDISFEIRQRIIDIFQIKKFTELTKEHGYPHGMIATYGFGSDECQTHIDWIWHPKHTTYHCVLLLTSPEKGGDLVIEEKPCNIQEKEGIYFPVSKMYHSSTKLEGEQNRLLWIFGFSVPEPKLIF
jgi:hypothetical protein